MRGVVRAYAGDQLTLDRAFAPGGHYDSLGDAKRVGDRGTIEVVEHGWVLRRAYYRADGQLIGELYNVQTPVRFLPGRVEYTDLEVDVVRRPDGSVEVVDEDDLAATVEIGGITPQLAEVARGIAQRLAAVLRRGEDWRAADANYRAAGAVLAPDG